MNAEKYEKVCSEEQRTEMNLKEEETEQDILLKEQEQLYTELTATFTDKNQFRLLSELIDTEIELEKGCGL